MQLLGRGLWGTRSGGCIFLRGRAEQHDGGVKHGENYDPADVAERQFLDTYAASNTPGIPPMAKPKAALGL